MVTTTIQLQEETKDRLAGLKDYEHETYEEIIVKLLDIVAEENLELSEKTKREIEESRKQFKLGKFVALGQLKKELGLK